MLRRWPSQWPQRMWLHFRIADCQPPCCFLRSLPFIDRLASTSRRYLSFSANGGGLPANGGYHGPKPVHRKLGARKRTLRDLKRCFQTPWTDICVLLSRQFKKRNSKITDGRRSQN